MQEADYFFLTCRISKRNNEESPLPFKKKQTLEGKDLCITLPFDVKNENSKPR